MLCDYLNRQVPLLDAHTRTCTCTYSPSIYMYMYLPVQIIMYLYVEVKDAAPLVLMRVSLTKFSECSLIDQTDKWRYFNFQVFCSAVASNLMLL